MNAPQRSDVVSKCCLIPRRSMEIVTPGRAFPSRSMMWPSILPVCAYAVSPKLKVSSVSATDLILVSRNVQKLDAVDFIGYFCVIACQYVYGVVFQPGRNEDAPGHQRLIVKRG